MITSSVYWIFTKLGHMIPPWKGKNPIYFGVITIIPFDNLYRRAYFVMHTFLVIKWIANYKIFGMKKFLILKTVFRYTIPYLIREIVSLKTLKLNQLYQIHMSPY